LDRKAYVFLLGFFTLLLSVTPVFAISNGRVNQTFDIWNTLQNILKDPQNLPTFITQIILGFGLGYFSGKAIKYILALIGILVVGFFMNLWRLDALTSLFESYGLSQEKVYSLSTAVITIIGATTILPVSIGFIIGIIVSIMR